MPSKNSKASRKVNKELPKKDKQANGESSESKSSNVSSNKGKIVEQSTKTQINVQNGQDAPSNKINRDLALSSKPLLNGQQSSKEKDQKQPIVFQTINELFEDRVKNHSDQHFICFPNRLGDEGKHEKLNFEMITYGKMGKMVNSISKKLNETFPSRKKGEKCRTIGFLCTSEFNFLINKLALIKLGHSILIISPNNSPSAVVHLMKSTNCSELLYSPGQRTIVEEAVKIMSGKGEKVQTCSWISSKEAEEMENSKEPIQVHFEKEDDEPLIYLHASGSSGHPKAIGRKQSDFANSHYQDVTHGLVLAPLFHTMCTGLVYSAMASLGSVILLPSSLSITSLNLVDLAKESLQRGFQNLYSVPLLLKLIFDSPGGFDVLKQFKSVIFGGASFPVALGDLLVESNVNLVSLYGSTETRMILSSNRDYKNDKQWNVLRPTETFLPHMIMEEVWKAGEQTIYELIVGKEYSNKVVSNRPDGSCATNDLFKKSKTVENGYIYHGRLDDTIVHISGVKTNPVPIEQEIRSSPFVREVIVFGQNRLQIGCLIIPYEDELKQYQEGQSNVSLLDRIWPTIQNSNRDSPAHSRIIRELVHTLPATTRFPSADKGSIIRAKTLKDYEILIEEIYRTYEDGIRTKNGGSTKQTNEQRQRYEVDTMEKALKLVRRCVHTALKEQKDEEVKVPKDDTNLFDVGCDSLTVVRIGTLIRSQADLPQDKAFRAYSPFDHPTIKELAELVFDLGRGIVKCNKEDAESEMKLIKEIYEKLSDRIKSRSGDRKSRVPNLRGDCVVLTGATGALGAHLLVQLCQLKSVEKVICLCRAKNNIQADQRVEESLTKRKAAKSMTICQLENATCTKIICLATDLNDSRLGLSNDLDSLEEILNDTTHIIHNAWPVNFSMGLAAFETSLNGLVNMLNLCSHSHRKCMPTFTFCSSISAVSSHAPDQFGKVLEIISDDPKDASQMGYGRSKWMAELLCKRAVKQIGGLDCRIVRIGQLSCDRQNGIWNEKEAWPALLKSAQVLGVLPDLHGKPLRWLPIDLAANLIVAVALQRKGRIPIIENPIVVHVVNPNSTGWVNVIEAMRQSNIRFKVVSLQRWLETLANGKHQDPFTNPAVKLLSFYNSWTEERRVEFEFDITQLQQTLQDQTDLVDQIKPIGNAILMKMIQAWKFSGFFS